MNNVVCYRRTGHTKTLTSTTEDKQDIPHIHTLANHINDFNMVQQWRDATKATKTTLSTTVSKLSFKDTKESQKSKSTKNAGFRGVRGVSEVEEWEDAFSTKGCSASQGCERVIVLAKGVPIIISVEA